MPCKRIGRIQQGYALYRYGLIVGCHQLCLSRKEEFRILSLEVECLDNILFAQFTIQACVKLRDSSSIGVETGQYSYFQLFWILLVLCLDILFVESCKHSVSDVKSLVCCHYRCSARVCNDHCVLLLLIVLVDECLDSIAELVHHHHLLLVDLLLLLCCIVVELDLLLLELLTLYLCY